MYHLSISSSDEVIFEGEVISARFPGISGYFEILSYHSPLITALQPGTINVTTATNEKLTFPVTGGFVEVSHNQATVLV